MKPERVVIVNEGGFGELNAAEGSYDNFIASLTRLLARMKRVDPQTKIEEGAVDVDTVQTHGDALKKAERGEVDCLIFVTRGMLSKARSIKERYPKVKVIVLTGLMPENEVILLGKGWTDSSVLRSVILQ